MASKSYFKQLSHESDREWVHVSHIERDVAGQVYLVLEDGRRAGMMTDLVVHPPSGHEPSGDIAYVRNEDVPEIEASFILTGDLLNEPPKPIEVQHNGCVSEQSANMIARRLPLDPPATLTISKEKHPFPPSGPYIKFNGNFCTWSCVDGGDVWHLTVTPHPVNDFSWSDD